jgi:GTP cyclohydrolase I
MDEEKLKKACGMIIEAIGEDADRDGLKKTPERFSRMWKEFSAGYSAEKDIADSATTFAGENYDEMVIVRDIEFYSLCEHHLLPFVGKVSVGYVPKKKIIGLSKIPRIVEVYARRLQNQERMTTQIADALSRILDPKGVAVRVSATHYCMSMRGVKKPHAMTDTSAVRGIFRSDSRTRSEFFHLIDR